MMRIRPRLRLALAALAAIVASTPACAQSADSAAKALRTGNYDDAIAMYRRLAVDTAPVRVHRGLVRALAEVGRYDEAEAAARRAVTRLGPEMSNVLGEVLYARGKTAAADSAFRAAVAQPATDSLMARVNLAVLLYDRGDIVEAMREFDHYVDVYNSGRKLTSEELTAVGIACRYLGIRDPTLTRDALRAFDEAVSADPGNMEPRIRVAYLFLEKYNGAEAQSSFTEVLDINPHSPLGLLGMAEELEFDSRPGADTLAAEALTVNPNLVTGHVFVAEQRLQSEDYDGALEAANRALAVNPVALEALSVVAAVRVLQGNNAAWQAAKGKVLAVNPRYAQMYVTAAELNARTRYYQRAADLAREGIALDSTNAAAYSELGMNLLRLGDVPGSKAALDRSFALDPFNVWVKNTLDLLDTFKNFAEIKTPRFVIYADKDEAPVLSLYVGDLAEKAYDTFSRTYNYRPQTPVRVEIYKRHADFSVRTVGLSGIGALGVSFGNVVAIDAPSARPLGDFNWQSTLWHELAHTFTLGVTDHAIPRWFSEGLSVFEEHRAGNGWGMDVSLGFLVALKNDKLVPVSRMNDGFMRPTYPEQLQHSYYEASLVFELIERDYGPAAIGKMLTAYKDGKSTEEAFRSVLGIDVTAFDTKFDSYLRTRFASALAGLRATPQAAAPSGDDGQAPAPPADPDAVIAHATQDTTDLIAQVAAGNALIGEDQLDQAIPFLRRAQRMFPEDASSDGPTALLAGIYKKQGKLALSANELARLTSVNENQYQANLALGDMLIQLNDSTGAAAAYERAVTIYPMDVALHVKLAPLYARTGDHAREIRERRAVVALHPSDLADAYYQLADACMRAGDTTGARREVLHALEEAPNFEKAQQLLLKLKSATPAPAGAP